MPSKLAASAFATFARRGIRNASLDHVAAGAGVTKGSVYWHYRSKRELIRAASEHYYRSYHERMVSEMAGGGDPLAMLERILRLNVRLCLIDRANRTFTLEILALSVHDKAIRESWRAFYEGVRAEYVKLLLTARPPGVENRRDAGHVANSLLEAFEGVKLRALFEPAICSDAAEEARIVSNLLEIAGIARPATAAPAASPRRRRPSRETSAAGKDPALSCKN